MLLAFIHHLHQLVLHQPGGIVVDPKRALELQRRDTLLALREQIDGEKPFLHCQAGAMEDSPGRERALMVALVALVELAAFQLTVARPATFGANKSVRPA